MAQRNRRRQRRRGGAREQGAVRRRRRPRPGRGARDRRSPPGCSTSPPTRRSLSSCKQVDEGGNSAIYAGDGSKLGLVASDEARTPVALERIPKELQLATVAIEDQRFYEHGGVDPEAIAPRGAQGPRSRRSGRGRLDDHPAAGPQPLHPQPRATTSNARSSRRSWRSSTPSATRKRRNPRPVPEHRLLRDGRRQHRGRRPGRLADLLLASRSGS